MVINRPGEAIYVADLDSGAVMTPYAALSRRSSDRFEARHGLGYSVFSSVQNDIALEVTQTRRRRGATCRGSGRRPGVRAHAR